MLPQVYCQCYQDLRQTLQSLQTDLTAKPGNLPTYPTQVQALMQRVMQLDLSTLPPELAQRCQRIHTEIHKQLRILATDLMFMAAAQQPATQALRSQQIRDRIHTLHDYCDQLLQ